LGVSIGGEGCKTEPCSGTLRLKELPRAELAHALANMGRAILILDNGRAQPIQLGSSPDEFAAGFDALPPIVCVCTQNCPLQQEVEAGY
jgi:hypothetical protein